MATTFDLIDTMEKSLTTTELADVLIDFMVKIHSETSALTALLDSRSGWSVKRRDYRDRTLKRIGTILKRHAHGLANKMAHDVAIVVLHNMKGMVAITLDPLIATTPGAVEQLRMMNRLYLSNMLHPR